MRFLGFVASAVFAASLLPSALVMAQEAPSPTGPPPASNAPAPAEENNPLQTLKIGTNLVNVYFSARDKSGFITNLKKDDCFIYENKELQEIRNFTQEKNLPLTIGILVDTSGSQQAMLPLEQQAGADFLKDVLTPKDEAFLISFDINVNLLQDYTNSPRELKRALDKTEINTGAGTGSVTGVGDPRGTLLYDAVYLAANEKLRQEAGRKIMVLLTDGGDEGSQENLKSAIEVSKKANAIVYVILLHDPRYRGGAYEMNQLTEATGGRVINVGYDGRRLQDAFDQIQDELRTQYLLSYRPKNTDFDGKFRTLNMDCGKGVKLQMRKGYYAIPDGASPDD
jgi:VWFA-related protein